MAHRIVSLDFSAPAGQSKVSLSVSAPEITEALKIIDEALVSQGFVRDPNQAEASVRGFIASYSRRNAEGVIPLGDNPSIWLHDDKLEVVFNEGRMPGGQISTVTTTVNILRTELSNHYGSKRVKIKHGRSS